MKKSVLIWPYLLAFGIPLLLILCLIALLQTHAVSVNADQLILFITIDFILTIPLIYLLLIRRTKVPNLTVAPFLILCIIIASNVIPSSGQDTLDMVKIWLLPIVELSVLSIVILKVIKGIKSYRKAAHHHPDFFNIVKETCESLFPKSAAKLVANEIALIYYGLINYKKVVLKWNEYSNYKGSGILSTLGAIIFVVAIEMVSIHILTSKWSTTLAWVFTGFSMYSALQLIGIIRSVPKRPIRIQENRLILRFGMLSETIIPLHMILSIETAHTDEYKKSKENKTLSLLGSLEHSNVKINVSNPQSIEFLYGKTKPYTTLYLFVDNHQSFITEVKALLSQSN